MKLSKWVEEQSAAKSTTKHAVLEDLSKRSGVSFYTCKLAARGGRLNRYDVAKAISTATADAVSVAELCE